ncbi:MAG TPA: hypothetical protein VN630_00790 [Rhodanobacteraceae bacterium]|nr:hypothetical protein [Rhodanobacteraceae bacterium]
MIERAAARKELHAHADAGWIDALAFTRRKESWVAASADRFYKIFRSSGDPARDWLDSACMEKARREYAAMRLLHQLDERACKPLRLDHGCIVYPNLSGPDLRERLLQHGPGIDRAAALRDAVSLLARLHAVTDAVSHYPLKDYLVDVFLDPDADVLRRIEERRRTLCIEGFEVRNFRYDAHHRAWTFFDPQVVSRGVPENDLARFIISLLMVSWGKGGSPKIWTHFDIGDLVSIYAHAASCSIDPVLLNYFLHETIAMRRHFAEKALGALHGVSRWIGRPYLSAYFVQLEHWAERSGSGHGI